MQSESHKYLSIKWPSYWFIDDHPFRTAWALFIADELERCFFDSFSSHHKVQGEDWIFLDKIIKKLTWTQIIFQVVQLHEDITELYLVAILDST